MLLQLDVRFLPQAWVFGAALKTEEPLEDGIYIRKRVSDERGKTQWFISQPHLLTHPYVNKQPRAPAPQLRTASHHGALPHRDRPNLKLSPNKHFLPQVDSYGVVGHHSSEKSNPHSYLPTSTYPTARSSKFESQTSFGETLGHLLP